MIQIDKPMPEGCDVCPFMYDYIQCKALPEDCIDDEAFYEDEFDWTKRPEWCPLKEQKAVKPKTGHWIFESAYCDVWSHTCSECGKRMTTACNIYANYCWNCGAKMKRR